MDRWDEIVKKFGNGEGVGWCIVFVLFCFFVVVGMY